MLLAVFAAPAAHAQSSVDASATVELMNESRVTKDGDLEFGTIVPGTAGGSITIAPNGAVTTTGVTSLGTTQPASFTMTRRFLLDFPTYEGPQGTDTIQLVHASDSTATMTLRDFTTDYNRTIFFGLPAYFFQTSYPFRVGGTLDVAADQKPGNYSGTFTVTIEFN